MPTIDEVRLSGGVVRIGGGLKPHQQPMRRLYCVQTVLEWMQTVLPNAQTDGFTVGAARPIYQVDNLFNRFIAGDDIEWPLPHPMRPDNLGIYRIRTDDVRLNGWFPEKSCFVIGSIDLKKNCSSVRDNQLRDEAAAARATLSINDGTYLLGDYRDHL